MRCDERVVEDQEKEVVEKRNDTNVMDGEQSKGNETTQAEPVEPYKPPIPFPQRLAKDKLEANFENLLEVCKKLYINIPFLGCYFKDTFICLVFKKYAFQYEKVLRKCNDFSYRGM